MIIALDEMKNYLRVDYEDDDVLLESLILSSTRLCKDIARVTTESELVADANSKIAVMYAVAYQYEHREEADHHALTLSLRSLLSGSRKVGF